ncbi:MAG: hypothetical protein CVU36_08315 [Betaproteobacteria bacterium HGW-Betaproteobacteria-9]|nr:MAG: hypothetical protein CVU36_08315 [Betaproteobacteria bacterium HGW-Betaproteobacteria-9]
MLAVACLAAGASWAQVTVDVVVDPVAVADPAVAARQQEMALQLARANLSQQGISEPTTAQLALATSDVQAQRDSGMGWGQIANSLGLRLGAVVSAANRADQADRVAAATTSTRPATAGSKAKGGNSGNSNAGGGQGAGSSGNQGGGSNAGGGGNAGGASGKGGNSGNGGGGNGGGKGGGNGGGKR